MEDIATETTACPIRKAALVVAELIAAHGCASKLHLVVDDLNVDDDSLEWCRNLPDFDEQAAYEALRPLDEGQRLAAIEMANQMSCIDYDYRSGCAYGSNL